MTVNPNGHNLAVELFEPIRIDPTAPPVDTERFPIFYIGEQEYTAPKKVPAGVAVRALEVTFQYGQAAAAWYMIEQAVGKEAIDDLTACPQLEHSQMQAMFAKLGEIYWGHLETMLGKSPVGRVKSGGS